MDPLFISEFHPGILCADERRYHTTVSVLGLTTSYPPIIHYRARTYIVASNMKDRKGNVIQVTYRSQDNYFFIVHNKGGVKS